MFKFLITLVLSVFLMGTLYAEEKSEEGVTKLYVATFNRAPDSDGISYWLNSSLTLEEVSKSFFEQPETKDLYPEGYSDTDFIVEVYANLFNRTPDDSGLKYWRKALNTSTTRSPQDDADLKAGNISRDNFILAVINGAQGDDATILSNKTEVGLAFSNSGANDVPKAKDIMKDITADRGSVDEAIATLSNKDKEEEKGDDTVKDEEQKDEESSKDEGKTVEEDEQKSDETVEKENSYKPKSRTTRSSIGVSTIIDGAGSIVSPNEDCFGCDKDVAIMHPHSDARSMVVFQWRYESSCSRLEITASHPVEVMIDYKSWSSLTSKRGYENVLLNPNSPIVINSLASWNTVAIRSYNTINQSISVKAECSTRQPSSAYSNAYGDSYIAISNSGASWPGTASLISQANNGSGYGNTKDWVAVRKGTVSYPTFQWYAKSGCKTLKLKANSESDVRMYAVKIKPWNKKDWELVNHCKGKTKECIISAPSNGYYVLKMMAIGDGTPDAGPNVLEATCY